MDLFFVLLTQFCNLTIYTLDFQVVNHGRRLLPKLPPGKTRYPKPSRILRRLGEYESGWKFRVLLNGEFSGVELDPHVILDYVRVVFSVNADGNVLCVDGVREIRGRFSIDVLFRHRFFGCMRNSKWNRRLPVPIARSDSKLATKLRNVKGHCQHLAPFVDLERYAPPAKPRSEDARIDDSKNNIKSRQHKSAKVVDQQVGPRDVTRPLDPPVKPGRQISIDDNENDINIPLPPKPRAKQARPRRPSVSSKEHASIDDSKNNIKNLQPKSARVAGQQVRPWDPPVKPGRRISIDDNENDINIPRPPEPSMEEDGLERLQRPNDATTAQRPRPRDDESSTNVVEKDSFVRGILFVFALMVCILLKFVF